MLSSVGILVSHLTSLCNFQVVRKKKNTDSIPDPLSLRPEPHLSDINRPIMTLIHIIKS